MFERFYHKIEHKLKALQAEREARKLQKQSLPWQEGDYASVSGAAKLLLEVKDIRDELNILNSLLTQQKEVWEKLLGLSVNEDGSIIQNETFLRETEKWKGPVFALKDFVEMDKNAQKIQDSVCVIVCSRFYLLTHQANLLLGIEQNEANFESAKKQTDETIEQGRTLMVFTIITIVFISGFQILDHVIGPD